MKRAVCQKRLYAILRFLSHKNGEWDHRYACFKKKSPNRLNLDKPLFTWEHTQFIVSNMHKPRTSNDMQTLQGRNSDYFSAQS